MCCKAQKSARTDLAALGERMHEEQTGRFLRAMVFRAWSEAQRSYTLGFLSHYAADSTLHPYVEALCAPGGVFGGQYGHGFCEAALDSELHEQDGHGRAVPTAGRRAGSFTQGAGRGLRAVCTRAFWRCTGWRFRVRPWQIASTILPGCTVCSAQARASAFLSMRCSFSWAGPAGA